MLLFSSDLLLILKLDSKWKQNWSIKKSINYLLTRSNETIQDDRFLSSCYCLGQICCSYWNWTARLPSLVGLTLWRAVGHLARRRRRVAGHPHQSNPILWDARLSLPNHQGSNKLLRRTLPEWRKISGNPQYQL